MLQANLTKRPRQLGELQSGMEFLDSCSDTHAMKRAAMAARPATAPKEPEMELAAPV